MLTNNYVALFAQEDIRLTSRLTANLGLRWDPRFDFDETDGKQMTFIPGTQSERFPNAFPGLQFLGDPLVKDTVDSAGPEQPRARASASPIRSRRGPWCAPPTASSTTCS